MPRLVISVDDETFRRLVGRAIDQRRDARDEAALLVEKALRKSRPDAPPAGLGQRESAGGR